MAGEHTGSVLFHLWPHHDTARAFKILKSIVQRGLLLTTTNRGMLDRFTVTDGEGKIRDIEVMQRPRVCFTDIPLHLLRQHGDKYGRFGLGFSRETIVSWGGCPAWYLPSHHAGNTLKDIGPLMVNGMHAAMVALENFTAVIRGFPALMVRAQGTPAEIQLDFTHGLPLQGQALVDWVQHGRLSVDLALSFVKEMSPPDIEDFRYLYEREWRIVEGLVFSGKNPCRMLTDLEKSELCSMNSGWKDVPTVTDINIQVRQRVGPIIDSFRFFNGSPGSDPVSHKIDVVMTPDASSAALVRKFVDSNPHAFKAGGPEIQIFPDQ